MSHRIDILILFFINFHRPPDKQYSMHRLIMGTHTAEGEQNYLQIVSVQLPNENAQIDSRKFDEEAGGNSFSK